MCQTVPLLAGHAASKLLSFAGFVFVARALGPVAFGGFTFAFTLASLLMFIPSMGCDPFYTRDVSAGRASARDLLGTVLVLKAAGGALFLALFVGGVFLTTPEASAREASVYVGPAFVVLAIAQTWKAVLITSGHPGTAGMVDVFQAGVFIAFIAVALPFWATPAWAAAGFLASQVAGAGLGLAAVSTTTGLPRMTWGIAAALRLLPATAPLAMIWFLGDLYLRVGAAILFYVHGSREAGLYAAPYRLVEGLYGVATVVCATALPRLSRAWAAGGEPWRTELWHALAAVGFLALGPVAAFVAVPNLLINSLYGPPYAEAATTLAILAPGSLLLCVSAMIGVGLTSVGLEYAQLKVTGAALLVNLLTSWFLIPGLRGNGAALATAAAALTYLSIGGVVLHRRTRRVKPEGASV